MYPGGIVAFYRKFQPEKYEEIANKTPVVDLEYFYETSI
jgi:hypothetical protein